MKTLITTFLLSVSFTFFGQKEKVLKSQVEFCKYEVEELEKKEALEKYGSEGSGKNLPFSNLSEDLSKKSKK